MAEEQVNHCHSVIAYIRLGTHTGLVRNRTLSTTFPVGIIYLFRPSQIRALPCSLSGMSVSPPTHTSSMNPGLEFWSVCPAFCPTHSFHPESSSLCLPVPYLLYILYVSFRLLFCQNMSLRKEKVEVIDSN